MFAEAGELDEASTQGNSGTEHMVLAPINIQLSRLDEGKRNGNHQLLETNRTFVPREIS